MKKIPLAGGAPQVICNIQEEFRGGVWLADGTILFSTVNSPIMRVSSEGGEPQQVTELNKAKSEQSHNWPSVLPSYKDFIFLAISTDLKERTLYLPAYTSLLLLGQTVIRSGQIALLLESQTSFFNVSHWKITLIFGNQD